MTAQTEERLHLAVCAAVAILNNSFDAARSAEVQRARNILRQALVDYADAFMGQPATEAETSRVKRKHARPPQKEPPHA